MEEILREEELDGVVIQDEFGLGRRDRMVWVFSPPSSLLLAHPFLWVVLLRCLTEKRRRQICSLQPLLATNEFRLHPNELLTEPLLHSDQSKTCKARSLEFAYGPEAKQKKYCHNLNTAVAQNSLVLCTQYCIGSNGGLILSVEITRFYAKANWMCSGVLWRSNVL